MNKTLSIIIPAYNMELYLRKCLNSLIIDRNFDLLDIIIVNDGSKDGTLEIAKEYECKYPSVCRVIDKPNGNYGSCVNIGLKNAIGKYVKILDADDTFDKKALEKVIDFLSKSYVDLLVTDYRLVDSCGREIRKIEYIDYLKPSVNVDFLSIPKMKGFARVIAMHAVIYRRENLLNINYYQTEGISYTDVEWIFIPMTTVDVTNYLHVCLYNYLIGREGQTVDHRIMLRNISHTIKGCYTMINEYIKLVDTPSAMNNYLVERLSIRLSYIYRKFLLENNHLDITNLIQLDNYIKDHSYVLYELVGSYVIDYFFPYKFVRNWRKSQHCNLPLIVYFASKLYVIKKFLKR